MARPDGASGKAKGILPQAHAKKSDETDEADDPCAASLIAFPQVSSYLPLPIEALHISGQSRDLIGTLQASVDAGGQNRDRADVLQASVDAGGQSRDRADVLQASANTGGQSRDRADVLQASVDTGIRLPEGTLAPLSSEDLSFVARAPGEEAVPGGARDDPAAIEGAAAPHESNPAADGLDPRAKESARLPSDMRLFDAKKTASESPRTVGENPQSKASAGLASGIRKGIDAKEAAPIGGSLNERPIVLSEPPRNGVRRADAPASPMAQAPRDEASSAAARNPRMMETPSAQTQAVSGDLPEKAAPRAIDDLTRTEDVAAPAAALAQSQPDGEAQGAERAQTALRTDAPHAAPEPGPSAQLARSAVGALARGESQFHLRLRPEGMGEVAVTIRARERELSLSIRASSGETRELILSQIDDLRGGLATGDYRLGELSVEVNASGHGGAAFSTFAQDKGNREAPRQPLKLSPVAEAEVPDRAIQTRKGAIMYRI